MIHLCNTPPTIANLAISDIADIANILIAIMNVVLAFYVFVYQRRKDKEDTRRTIEIQDQSTRLQWFKELIISPHLKDIFEYYEHMHGIEQRFAQPISDDKKIEIVGFIKGKQRILRVGFVDVLLSVDRNLHIAIKSNLDKLTDDLTITILDTDLNLSDKKVYAEQISKKISYSKNDLLNKIYNYKGITELSNSSS